MLSLTKSKKSRKNCRKFLIKNQNNNSKIKLNKYSSVFSLCVFPSLSILPTA